MDRETSMDVKKRPAGELLLRASSLALRLRDAIAHRKESGFP